ncbi:metal ABC transporter ATP-binding protein [Bradyrhizobium diversitatis]|uniref:ABC transporter ATP-binding protein n=1 Tax=Bradyrhizobium diversitatis TaxID=2755406 RepID=A0ABS0P5I2_9BRAD|nr:ABC transporter ATP-binding protein [Bradyrhizobium diversitatis]MBH5388550.1 ABC transporter ATP-binding protein [Bradyrhizobium diversitatis]
MSPSSIHLQDVTIAFDRHPAVHHLSGSFVPGSLTAIVGPNGAGKSTLLRALMNDLPLASGRIDRGHVMPTDIGYLPQAADIDRRFPITVGDVVLLGSWRQAGAFRAVSEGSVSEARRALSSVGLTGFEQRLIGTLSAGQFQRVLFARLLLQNAKLILLDEPFTAIDARTTHDLLQVVRRWHQDGRTVIAVLHDVEQVRAHFPQTLLLAREPVAWGPTATTMTSDYLMRARLMAERWDETAAICDVPDQSAA